MTRHLHRTLLTVVLLILGLSLAPATAGAVARATGVVHSGHPMLYLPPAQQSRLNAAHAAHLRTIRPSITAKVSSTDAPPAAKPNPYPGAQLVYQGGSLVVDPTVYLIAFTTDGSPAVASNYTPNTFATGDPGTANAVTAMFNSSWYQTWTKEYSTPQYQLGGGKYGGTISLAAPDIANATTVTDAQITSALVSAANAGTLPSGPNVVDVLFFTSAQTIVMSDGTNSVTGFCGYHNYVYTGSSAVNYVVMPDEATSTGCSPAEGIYPAFDSMTATLSHELAELITDPNPGTGWVDPSYRTELADLCGGMWSSQPTTVSPNYAYAVQRVWSNATNNCVAGPEPTTITATQTATGLQVNLSVWIMPIANAPLTVSVGTAPATTVTTDTSGNAVIALPATWSPTDSVSVSYPGDALTQASSLTWTSQNGSPYSATSPDQQPDQSWQAPAVFPSSTVLNGQQIGNVPGHQAITVSLGMTGVGVTIVGPTGRYFSWTDPTGVASFSIPVTGTADTYNVFIQPNDYATSFTAVTVAAAPLNPVPPAKSSSPKKNAPKKNAPKKNAPTPGITQTGTVRYFAWVVAMRVADGATAQASSHHRAVTVAAYALAARRVPGVTVRAGSRPGVARFVVQPNQHQYGGSVCVTLPPTGGQPYLVGRSGNGAC